MSEGSVGGMTCPHSEEEMTVERNGDGTFVHGARGSGVAELEVGSAGPVPAILYSEVVAPHASRDH
jgi:hypothetical protein